ncbi:hypothetical protein MMYC01_207659 [Madurella mycetomatis]|uniref:HNH nuclease domain-containing protein n=1 Tax=Madurella mycetomatis TaxID=100816 RepID=A0A175VW00_9PEZI|nr:hypothetical protein MMYC01_207659 [Madurella mycetomatis]
MQLKQAFTLPKTSDDDRSSKVIHFRHPAYPDTEPDLLRLGALDGDGTQYDITFISCCIFRSNHMDRYCRLPTDPRTINDERNLIILRRDLNHVLDTRRFTFAANQLSGLHHNGALQQPTWGLAVEFLFARFAWTLFTDEHMPFLNGLVRHNVLLFDPSEGRLDEEVLRSSEVRKHAKFCESYSCSRSVSPKKRQRSSQPWSQTDVEAFESERCGVSPFDLEVSDSGED